MSDQLIALVVPQKDEPFSILASDIGIGKAAAHSGCVNLDGLSKESLRVCLKERLAILAEIHSFVAMLESDPAWVEWKLAGSPSVPADAFSGDFGDVAVSEDREGFVGC